MSSSAHNLEHAQQLLLNLAPAQVAAVIHLMEVMLDSGARTFPNAPSEDEEITEDEEHAVEEAREWRKHNRPISHEELLADLGLTPADFERMSQTPHPAEPYGSNN